MPVNSILPLPLNIDCITDFFIAVIQVLFVLCVELGLFAAKLLSCFIPLFVLL